MATTTTFYHISHNDWIIDGAESIHAADNLTQADLILNTDGHSINYTDYDSIQLTAAEIKANPQVNALYSKLSAIDDLKVTLNPDGSIDAVPDINADSQYSHVYTSSRCRKNTPKT